MIEKNKNNRIHIENTWRSTGIFISMLLMLFSLLISRGALSVSMLLFFCITLLHKKFFQQLKIAFTSTLLLSFSCLFFIPFISGLWSDDINKWLDVVRIKLPLLFFPIAFAGEWKLSNKQWLIVAVSFLLIVFGGCLWGLIDYLQNIDAVHAGYLRAKTITTPLEDDHVRFSWMVSIACMVCILLLQLTKEKGKKVLLFACLIFFVFYLHILSARTGIVSLYIFLFVYACYFLWRKATAKRAIILILTVCLLPAIAYFTIPTLQARVRYILYDASFVQKGEYLPGSNDGARVMSLKAGWQVLRQNPMGTGAGDIMHEANKWYAVNVPQVLATDKFYPSSEWLMYGGFAGWVGIILFTAIMAIPFFYKRHQHKIFWIAFNATAAFSFAFDMGLEVQYGIFLYAFSFFCWWKGMRDGRQKK